jgi:hypothetical protein
MDIKEWDQKWKDIQKDRDGRHTTREILDHWKAEIPENACLRAGWPGMKGKPSIEHLGYRKKSKAGHETAGEKGLERKLLGESGKIKIHYVEKGEESLRLQVFFHNMGLGTGRSSQKIIDCFGVITVGDKNFPTAIEVKTNNEGPWYAVIENLVQVQMLQQNLENLQKYFGESPLSFGRLSQAWGVVLAPEVYFTSKRNEESFTRARELLEQVGDEIKLTLVQCDDELVGAKAVSESLSQKETDWRLSYVGGFWPSETDALKLS